MMFRMYIKQLVMNLKLMTRIPSAVFWMFAFPSVMLLGMGTVFSGSSDNGPKLVWSQDVARATDGDALLQKALKDRGVHLEVLSPADADQRWASGKLAVMLQGQDGHYRLRMNSYLMAQAGMAEAMVQQAFMTSQARAQGVAELARIPDDISSPGGHGAGPYAAYLLPGLLGLNLLMLGIFSTGMVDVMMREQGGYKRLATTPMPRSIFLAAQVSMRIIMVVLSGTLLMTVGALVFGIRNQGGYGDLLAVTILGAACFLSMGFVLGSLAKSVESYNGIGNLAFLPMMLLSGVYFSLDSAPVWFQRLADALPLTPVLRMLRAIFNDGASLSSLSGSVAIVCAWTLVLFLLAVRRFKWV
jgi:ABC-type multidrug transport system permease subunit